MRLSNKILEIIIEILQRWNYNFKKPKKKKKRKNKCGLDHIYNILLLLLRPFSIKPMLPAYSSPSCEWPSWVMYKII